MVQCRALGRQDQEQDEAACPFPSPTHRRAEPRARAGAAVRGRGRLSVLPLYRRHAASGLRLVLADQDRAVDPRSPRRALHRLLFLHAARRALDLDLLAVASDVRVLLCALGLGRAGDPHRGRDCSVGRNLRASARCASRNAALRAVRDAGGRALAASYPGAAAHAGAARDDRMGRHADGGGRSQGRAVLVLAAADVAVGEPAWRLRAGAGADRPDGDRGDLDARFRQAGPVARALVPVRRRGDGLLPASRPMAGARCWVRPTSSISANCCRSSRNGCRRISPRSPRSKPRFSA